MSDTSANTIELAPFRHFQELVIYFFVAGVIGHYLELLWVLMRFGPSDVQYFQHALLLLPLPLSEPFGLGAIAAVTLLVPFVKERQPNLLLVYGYSIILMAAVEYVCALTLTLVFGHNNFWDYSAMPLNLQGYICLETGMSFGLVAMLFVYGIYPFMQTHIQRLDDVKVRLISLALILLYAYNFLFIVLRG